MTTRKHCYGCINLKTQPDAAGGGTYQCVLCPCLVIGEWGHWTDESDEPREINDCAKEWTGDYVSNNMPKAVARAAYEALTKKEWRDD